MARQIFMKFSHIKFNQNHVSVLDLYILDPELLWVVGRALIKSTKEKNSRQSYIETHIPC